ncbi:MAG: ATP-binding cassette domain-containing protein, partial [Spirochaetaceae bacterium]|nr:ATP-binding cassette domain-containing protein [Spirochaetaceae bacterium]
MNGVVIRLDHITKSFKIIENSDSAQIRSGRFYALDDVSLEFTAGSCSIVAGANGSGKSLLMALIAQLEEPSSGTVEVSGNVGLIFQDADSQILGETA